MSSTSLNGEYRPAGSFFLEKIAFVILSIFVVLFPILTVPSSWISFAYTKLAVVTLAVGLVLVLFIIQALQKGSMIVYGRSLLVAFVALPIVMLASAFRTSHVTGSLIGVGSEFDTVYAVGMGFLLVYLTSLVFSTKQRIFKAYILFFLTFIGVAIFHLARFVFGGTFAGLQEVLPTMSSNTIGSWSDFGIYSGLAVLLSFITLEFFPLQRVLKIFCSITLAMSLTLMVITNFKAMVVTAAFSLTLSVLIGMIALFVVVYVLSKNYEKTAQSLDTLHNNGTRRIPIASLIVLVVAVVSTIAMSPLTSLVYKNIRISAVEVVDIRPTFGTTLNIAKSVVFSDPWHAFLGVGPNRFYTAWALYKPLSINQTPFWNADFGYGSGYLPTFFSTTGIAGILGWVLFLGALMYFGIKGVFAKNKDSFSQYLMLSSFVCAMYLWMLAFFIVTGPVPLFLAFFFSGLLFASLVCEKIIATYEYHWTAHPKKSFVTVLLLVSALIGAVSIAGVWTYSFSGAVLAEKAAAYAYQGNLSEAEDRLISSLRYRNSDTYLRMLTQVKLAQLKQALDAQASPELKAAAPQMLSDVLAIARQAAVAVDSSNYQNWILLGAVYESAGLLGVEGAGDYALQSYMYASELLPTSPLADLLIARLYVYAKDQTQALRFVEQALQKKPDSQDAQNLLEQIKSLQVAAPEQTVLPDQPKTPRAKTTQ